ncbi:MAG: hypothetical protein JRD04_06965 [Deltaproteobacteria bacterium]|nr:hypothetical protein [Deltaproteobacteria bacterium]
MTDRKLLAGLSKLGFPMFEPSETLDVNETLADVVKSHDARLWEGFPVLLANATESYSFVPEQVEQHLMGKEQKDHFHHLMLFSGALFSLYHLSFPWWTRLTGHLSKEDKVLVKAWKNDLARNHTLKWLDAVIDPERAKGLFELYFEQKAEKDRRRKEKFEGLSLEYALSQVFAPKQKELFKKKLEGLLLTKTEQEYYSRTVKKKVVALANGDLHSLSKKLLGL